MTRNPLATAVLEALRAPAADSVESLPFPAAGRDRSPAGLHGEPEHRYARGVQPRLSVALNGRGGKFMLTVVPIPEFWKGRFGAVAILYDVTDFARLDELRMELVGVASHELKTPLTTLRMNLLLLEEDAANLTPRQHEILVHGDPRRPGAGQHDRRTARPHPHRSGTDSAVTGALTFTP